MDENNQEQLTGDIGTVVAAVESEMEEALNDLEARVTALEQKVEALTSKADSLEASAAAVARRTAVSAPRTGVDTSRTMMAKHGVEDGSTNVAAVDAALRSLPIEQRLTVKSELMRAGVVRF